MDVVLLFGRWLGLVTPPAPVPAGPPIERIAADVRRIRTDLHAIPPGMPVARRRGWEAAYDDVLLLACRSLQLETRLATCRAGVERELERERVERMLVGFGLLSRASA